MYLGGNIGGTRIPKLYKDNIDEQTVLAELDGLIGRWATERTTDEQGNKESFGDFVIRAGIVEEVIISVRDFHD